MRCLLLSLLFLSALAEAAPLPSATPGSVGLSKARLDTLSPMMDAHVAAGKVPAVATAVTKNGKLVHLSLHGYQDHQQKRPLTRDTIFRIYSMTKPVTAVAAMMLYEEGHFQLFDPVSTYIPAFKNTQVFVGGTADNPKLAPMNRPITIHDLFKHTACLTYPFTTKPVDELYRRAHLFDGKRSSAQFVDAVAKLPLACQPGSRHSYGVATDVLGRIVEIIAKEPLDNFMQRRIFGPLQMVDTGFHVPTAKHRRFIRMYQRDKSGVLKPVDKALRDGFLSKPKMASGGGGLVSTVDDYLKFTQMLLNEGSYNGKRLLSATTVRFMLSEHTTPAQRLSEGYGMGLGFGINVDPVRRGNVGFPGEAGWSGIANTFFWLVPQKNLAYMAWSQFFPWGGSDFRHQVKTVVNTAIEK